MGVKQLLRGPRAVLATAALAVALAAAQPAALAGSGPLEGTRVIATALSFEALWDKLKEAFALV